VTCSISGTGLNELAQTLHSNPAIHVASFGATLHVSSASESALGEALAPYRASGVRITPIDTNLEDVFIALMQQSQDDSP
jgi:ABC-2 type transport system ATP-binding protein